MMPKERYIELDVTYRCSAKCAHCCFACSPQKNSVMRVKDAREFIAETKKLGLTDMQIRITGGEAMLYYDTVLGIVKAAGELGMTPIHSLQSNGSWATSDALVRTRFEALSDAGLSGVYFSQDVFHRPFVPVQRVRRAVRIADEIFGPDHVVVPREVLAQDSMPGIAEHADIIRRYPPLMVGRALWALEQYVDTVPLEDILKQNCTGGRVDLDPRSVWQINVDAYGWVSSWICSGIALGNALRTPLSEILARPLEDHPQTVQEIVARGPGAMLEMAARHGFKPKDRYAGKCHLCYDIRTAIHEHYPELFAPAALYAD